MSDHPNPPTLHQGSADRVAELAAMKALAREGIRVRSSRQRRTGAYCDLPWVGDTTPMRIDGEQLELFHGEEP